MTLQAGSVPLPVLIDGRRDPLVALSEFQLLVLGAERVDLPLEPGSRGFLFALALLDGPLHGLFLHFGNFTSVIAFIVSMVDLSAAFSRRNASMRPLRDKYFARD